MNALQAAIMDRRDPEQAVVLARFFQTGKGQYGEGDKFLGVKVPVIRAVVKEHWRAAELADLRACLASPWHEVRLAALLALVQRFRHAKKDLAAQRECVDCYLAHADRVNNWDLVDLSCYEILGTWLLDKDRAILYDLAAEGRTLWENRIAIVSTMQFVRHGQHADTLALAARLLPHPHPLIHKAVGWLLREVGKRDRALLTGFLAQNCGNMPRTALRYAIERLPEPELQKWLVAGKDAARPRGRESGKRAVEKNERKPPQHKHRKS